MELVKNTINKSFWMNMDFLSSSLRGNDFCSYSGKGNEVLPSTDINLVPILSEIQ